jgi:glycosyltransferase involved in cell wall biosynthesis
VRILLVHNRYRSAEPSGENHVVESEAHELRQRGHDVQVWGPSSDEIADQSPLRKLLLPARVVWSRDSARALAAALDEDRPDVVHLHNTFPLISGSILPVLRARGVPTVATVHNYRLICAGGSLFRDGQVCHDCLPSSHWPGVRHGCYRESRVATAPVALSNAVHDDRWKALDAVLTLSSAQRDLLIEAGYSPERVIVKPNFVAEHPGSADHGPPGTGFVYAGRWADTKGVQVILDAWALLERRGLLPELTIIGSGPLEDEVARFAVDRPNVRVLGRVTRDECFEEFEQARAVLVPSVWEETFGLVVAEAMMFGRAAVCSNRGSFPDLITDGTDGLLVRPADPEALAAAVEKLHGDEALAARLGERARVTYESRFRPEPNMELLESIYERVLGMVRS